MKWYQTYDGAFFLAIGTMLMGVLGLLIRYSYRSRCTHVKCCCLEIERDIAGEIESDEHVPLPSSEKKE